MSIWILTGIAALLLAAFWVVFFLLRKQKPRLFRVLAIVLCALFLLACAAVTVTAVGNRLRRARAAAPSLVLTEGRLPDADRLSEYESLTLLDLRGRTDVTAAYVDAAKAALPDACTVLWSIPLTDGVFDSDEPALVLPRFAEQDAALLPYFSQLVSVDASGSTAYMTLFELSEAMPDTAFVYALPLGDAVMTNADAEAAASGAPDWTLLLSALSAFPKLRSLDLTAAETDNAHVQALIAAYPAVSVRWNVAVGAHTADSACETVSLSGAALATASDALTLLSCFPDLKSVDLADCGLDGSALRKVAAERPDLNVSFPVTVCGVSCNAADASLDLRSATVDPDRLAEALSAFAALETVYLPDGLEEAALAPVLDAYPGVLFVRRVTVFGQETVNDIESLDISRQAVTAAEVEQALAVLPRLKTLVMCRCGLDDAAMDALCKAHPGIKFVWEVMIGPHKVRTDAVAFSTRNPSKYTNPNATDAYNEKVRKTKRLKPGDLEPLKYCTELRALDLGHNYLVNEDLEVLSYLPKLEVLILADNKFTDISALTVLTELSYVELFMNSISDVTPLLLLPKLADVNVCNINLEDPSALAKLPAVKRLWFSMNEYSRDEASRIAEQLPGCECNYTVTDETEGGWREHPRYDWMRAFFKED